MRWYGTPSRRPSFTTSALLWLMNGASKEHSLPDPSKIMHRPWIYRSVLYSLGMRYRRIIAMGTIVDSSRSLEIRLRKPLQIGIDILNGT